MNGAALLKGWRRLRQSERLTRGMVYEGKRDWAILLLTGKSSATRR